MSLTAQVKSELVRVPVGNTETRRAEVASLLRFAGTLQVLSGRLVIEAEVDSGEIADRLAGELDSLFSVACEIHPIGASGGRPARKFVLRVIDRGADLARQLGLIDNTGRTARGLPAAVVGGSVAAAGSSRASAASMASRTVARINGRSGCDVVMSGGVKSTLVSSSDLARSAAMPPKGSAALKPSKPHSNNDRLTMGCVPHR